MRKRTKLGLFSAIGAMILIVVAGSNWLLAAVIGMGIGAIVFLVVHTYPNDVAPPSDRRHENTVRRRSAAQQQQRQP